MYIHKQGGSLRGFLGGGGEVWYVIALGDGRGGGGGFCNGK